MRPLPPRGKGEGSLQEGCFPEFTIQLPAVCIRAAVPAIPTQSKPFLHATGRPHTQFPPGSFLPRVWLLPMRLLPTPAGQGLGVCRRPGARVWRRLSVPWDTEA